jgi:glutathione S-transferase
MALKLYELVGADDRRFSPYCWRARMALAHKQLAAELIPCKFTDKELIAFSGQTKVPVLVHNDEVISDSWAIACYLEDRYPERASLFGADYGRLLTKFFNSWVDNEVNTVLIRMVVKDIYDCVHPDDRDYFRRTREARFGRCLEEIQAERQTYLERLSQILAPVRTMLEGQPYLCGKSPAYADYILFGTFQWIRCASTLEVLQKDDPLYSWRERLLDAFDGMARRHSRLAQAA